MAVEINTKTRTAEDIEFFGAIDRKGQKPDGELASSIPSWYNERMLEDLREEIASRRRAIERGQVPPDAVAVTQATIERKQRRLDEIEASRPKFNAGQRKFIEKVHRELETEICGSLYTYDEMNTGEASPHHEAAKMLKPCVKINRIVAEKMGLKTDDEGKVSRNEAIKAWKIIGKCIGSGTHTETLRRKQLTCRMQKVDTFVGEDIGRETATEGIEGSAG